MFFNNSQLQGKLNGSFIVIEVCGKYFIATRWGC